MKKVLCMLIMTIAIGIMGTIFFVSKQKNSEIIFISSAALSGPLKEIGNEYIKGIETYFKS